MTRPSPMIDRALSAAAIYGVLRHLQLVIATATIEATCAGLTGSHQGICTWYGQPTDDCVRPRNVDVHAQRAETARVMESAWTWLVRLLRLVAPQVRERPHLHRERVRHADKAVAPGLAAGGHAWPWPERRRMWAARLASTRSSASPAERTTPATLPRGRRSKPTSTPMRVMVLLRLSARHHRQLHRCGRSVR